MGFNTPLQYCCEMGAELSVCGEDVIHYVRGTDCNVMFGGVMFGQVISKIGLSGFPVDM